MSTSPAARLETFASRLANPDGTLSTPHALLKQLLSSSVVLWEQWEELSAATQAELRQSRDCTTLLSRLVDLGLLNAYQAARISANKLHGLILGNYRILNRLGSGGMGVVYLAEHVRLRRQVAIKVLTLSPHQEPALLMRFLAEVRAVSQLQHPHIVGALDVGELPAAGADAPGLHYFVMEYVNGQDLERFIQENGPLSVQRACDIACQLAEALGEAHKHQLVHRDLKPSNILLTPEGQAKLLDFGLALQFGHRMTEPGAVLGTLDYMAPEQAKDASTVDIRADIYGLGAVMFWCLTGKPPFSCKGNLARYLSLRMSQETPLLRTVRPELPAELEAVVARMTASDPERRYPTPADVTRALLPFVRVAAFPEETGISTGQSSLHLLKKTDLPPRLLLVDDDASVRKLCRLALEACGCVCEEAESGAEAEAVIAQYAYDLVLLDVHLPDANGLDLLPRLRKLERGSPHMKIAMMSGEANPDDLAQAMLQGADDYLVKPFSVVQVQSRVKSLLRVRSEQQIGDQHGKVMLALNADLEKKLSEQNHNLHLARNALIMALARLAQTRDTDTAAHLTRLQRYCRALGEEASRMPAFAGQIDAPFVEMLEYCVPLHDIGKVSLPDHILNKPGKLDAEERLQMQVHTTIAAEILSQLAEEYGVSLPFLRLAIEITRHHHERWDGTGYPDGLRGKEIPLSARIVAIADVYDAMRSRRAYKPPLSHNTTVLAMTQATAGHFDPDLLAAFQRRAGEFERIFRECPD